MRCHGSHRLARVCRATDDAGGGGGDGGDGNVAIAMFDGVDNVADTVIACADGVVGVGGGWWCTHRRRYRR